MVEGTEFAGHKLAVDDRSVLLIDCANHDERIFDASNRLNFCREPNPRPAFRLDFTSASKPPSLVSRRDTRCQACSAALAARAYWLAIVFLTALH